MSRMNEEQNAKLEESKMTPPEETGIDQEMLKDEQEAIEAIRKFTDEDDDELGEISVKSILGGDFLMSKFMIKQIMFVMFCVLLMIIYTGNRYDSQQDAILIDSLRGRLQEVKYNVLTQSSELMNLTRQSNVEKRLKDTPDSLLHNSITPPFLVKSDKRIREEQGRKDLEEVLVAEKEIDRQGPDAMADEVTEEASQSKETQQKSPQEAQQKSPQEQQPKTSPDTMPKTQPAVQSPTQSTTQNP